MRSIILALALLIANAQGLGAADLTPVKVAWIPGDIAAEVWYAKDLGYFTKLGLDVDITPIPSGPAISSAVASNAIDVGYSNVLTLAIAHEKGIPFRVIAAANLNAASAPTAGLLVVKSDSPIRTAKDLEGKTLGVAGLDNIAYFAARLWVDQNGGDSSKVRFVEMPLPQLGAAVRAGRIDAAPIDALGDPTLGKPDDPLRLLAASFNAISPNFVLSGWFANAQWLTTHQDAAHKFAEAIYQAAGWANAHHHESAEILAKHTQLTVDQIEKATRVPYSTSLSPALIQPSIDVGAKFNMLKRAFPASELIGQ
jgi:NitT/TauT family transport system substrate-binding protein